MTKPTGKPKGRPVKLPPLPADGALEKLTPVERAYAMHRFQGKVVVEAYRLALAAHTPEVLDTVSESAIEQRAYRLHRARRIDAAIADLRNQAQKAGEAQAVQTMGDAFAVDKLYVMKTLHTITERCMQAEPVKDPHGKPLVITTGKGELAAAYRFDAKSATASVALLGKELGMFVDRKEIRSGPLGEVPEAELDKRIAELAKEVAEATGQTVAAVLAQHQIETPAAEEAEPQFEVGQGGVPEYKMGPIH